MFSLHILTETHTIKNIKVKGQSSLIMGHASAIFQLVAQLREHFQRLQEFEHYEGFLDCENLMHEALTPYSSESSSPSFRLKTGYRVGV